MQPGQMAVDSSTARSARALATQTLSQRTVRRNGYLIPHEAPESYDVIAQSGERRHFGPGPAVFIVRVRDLSVWSRLGVAGTYQIATAFVHGEFDIEGDLL